MKNQPKHASPITQAAARLGDDILEMQRLSAELSKVEVNSDSGLDRARALLKHFTECSQRIGEEMKALGGALDEGRQQVEAAVETVAARASAIQERQAEAEQMLSRFNTLSDMVRKVADAVAPLQGQGHSKEVAERLPEIRTNLDVLIEEARSIKSQAKAANMRTMESNADSLMHSLQGIQRKLQTLGS